MCGRYTQTVSLDALAERFRILLPDPPEFELLPRYNVAPAQEAPVIVGANGGRGMFLMRWGLIPSWAKDMSIGYKTINARSETLADKPAFKSAFALRRCLVVADGFYEWVASGRLKRPMRVTLKSGAPFGMAGIWEAWRGAGREIKSFSIITIPANTAVASLHERMPAIVAADNEDLWLDPSASRESLSRVLSPVAPDELKIEPASSRVNSALNEGRACLVPDN